MPAGKILVSSCLIGKKCAYDTRDRLSEKVLVLCEKYGYVDVCPEVSGGLPTPRQKHEIDCGSGEDVIDGKCRVTGIDGEDVSAQFIHGARIALEKAISNDITVAILKARSPSCGVGRVHSGSFDRTLKEGNGVTAALLIRNGIKVFTEEETGPAEALLAV